MLLILLGGGAASAQLGGKSVAVTERTRAELLAYAPEGVEQGKPVWVGLQLAHQPDWHSYWKNSGDSGLPTKLEWKLGFAWLLAEQISAARPERVAAANDGAWQAWEPGRVEQLLTSGRPVFVDFTAAWCVTCQYNKKTVLQDPEVQADLAARNIALLRADWTLRDPAITAALAALARFSKQSRGLARGHRLIE